MIASRNSVSEKSLVSFLSRLRPLRLPPAISTRLPPTNREWPRPTARPLLEQSGEPTIRHVAVRRVRHTPIKRPIETQFASHGIASFYSDEQQTANGEKFDPNAMTAAHRSLPFGTKLRVTNLATGRSVTVRVNDRGPYIAGRVVDVSYSAAEIFGKS
jgi:rare lipoprotein A